MKIKGRILATTILSIVICCGEKSPENGNPTDENQGQALHAVLFNEVHLEDNFWKPRLKVQADTLVPFALDKTQRAVENLEKTAKFNQGDATDLPFPHRYIASDLYKVMEGAVLSLMENPNPALEKRLDGIIETIGKAQKEDGYLYEAHITGVSKDYPDKFGEAGMGDKPYSHVFHSHELYNMGHMYEAAIAYYRSTGKDKWLKIAEKNAKHINKVFFKGDPNYNDGKPVNQAPGHEEIELALVKLYKTTDNDLYLDMAKKFLDIRGKTFVPDGEGVMSARYAQQHIPVSEQTEAVGHAVRAAYLYAGMADVAALGDSTDYDKALNSIWHNIVDTRMHITGGLGAVHGIEGFGEEYELPNKEAYNETCAAVGNVLFNHRLFLQHKDAKYMDVAEISLFNNTLAGMNLSGNRFFYVNPLESDGSTPFNQGTAGRAPWFDTACCPSNLARLLPQVSGMMYAHTDNEIYTTLYASNSTEITLKNGKVKLKQTSNYPFDGTVQLTVNPIKEQQFNLKLRIPSWAREQFVPGALYSFTDKPSEKIELTVNGETMTLSMDKGFATLYRTWKPNDRVSLTLPMPVKFNTAVEQVEADRGKIAITKGPLVYCAEGVDNDGEVQRFFLDGIPKDETIKTATLDEASMNSIVSVELPAKANEKEGTEQETLKLIPYYAWNNRGETSMVVWFPEKGSK